jgi:predicted TPR repeat methyltransferase
MICAVLPHDARAESRFARGQAALADGALDEAAELTEQALDLAPDWVGAWAALGAIQMRRGDRAGAVAAYQMALRLDPDDCNGAALALATAAGPVPDAAPAAYVAALFDAYAARFDTHLTAGLGYSGPGDIRTALLAAGHAACGRTLDLGCGTGLCGAALRPHATTLVGIDLSPRMVALAQAKGLYDRLVVGDFLTALADEPQAGADTIVIGDVLIYFGALGPPFHAAARVLRPGGMLAFTVQSLAAPSGYAVGLDLRFAHAAAYVRAELADAGFALVSCVAKSQRRENGIAVPGLVVVARRA